MLPTVSYVCTCLLENSWYFITVVMIFRVYALYGRSRKILGLLLLIYSGEVVATVGAGIVYSMPGATVGGFKSFI